MYSLPREYLLNHMMLGEILRHWHYGFQYDMQRRGYRPKKTTSKEDLDELRKRYYSPQEQAEIEAFMKSRKGK